MSVLYRTLPFVIAAATLLSASTIALAHSFTKGDIVIGHPWARATPDGAKVGGGYLKITNNGKSSDVLTGGTFEGAASVEVHEMSMDGGVMKMRSLSDGLEIKPGQTVELKPGGYHLMFLGLSKAISVGPKIKGTLKFKSAGAVDVEYKIEPIGAASSHDAAGAGHEHKGH